MSTKVKRILVIGASIAGPAVCYWLKRFGFEPTLIERNHTLRMGGYAIDIRGIAVDVAKQMGVYEDIVMSRTSIKSNAHINEKGETIHEELGDTFGFREGDDVEIVRSELVQILMQCIKEIPCRFNCYTTKIEQKEECVYVEFNDGSTETFDLIIGADGLHSKTRKHCFAHDEQAYNYLDSYISVFSAPNHWKLDQSSLFYEKDEKSIYIFSDHDPSESLIGLMFRAKSPYKNIKTREDQINCLQEVFQNFGWKIETIFKLLKQSNNLYFDSNTQVMMPSWSKQRVVLVGDSGYCASPLSGQGTSLALVGAYIFAGELKLAQGNHIEAFERYNCKLRPFVEANQALGAWVSEFFMVKDEQSPEAIDQRNKDIMNRINLAANSISLPNYD